jgi:hypothetical protein
MAGLDARFPHYYGMHPHPALRMDSLFQFLKAHQHTSCPVCAPKGVLYPRQIGDRATIRIPLS